jgi:hypothetical protein
VFKEPQVLFNPGQASYAGFKRVSKLKFEEYIPILESLPVFGYNREKILESIKLFLKNQSHSHLLYNFLNPINSLKLYKYYNLDTFSKLPHNIISYLKLLVSDKK